MMPKSTHLDRKTFKESDESTVKIEIYVRSCKASVIELISEYPEFLKVVSQTIIAIPLTRVNGENNLS